MNGLEFCHPDDARSVLRREHIKELFEHLPWYNEDLRTDLAKSMKLIMCILIFANTTEWLNFPRYFYLDSDMKTPRYSDQDLPIKDTDFFQDAPSDLRKQFLAKQYIFCPVVVKENSHATYSSEYRLPILRVEKLNIVSAQGDVKKVVIEKRYLQYANRSQNYAVSSCPD